MYLSNRCQPTHCCQICQRRSKGPGRRVSQVTSAWHSESKSRIKEKEMRGGRGGGSRPRDTIILSSGCEPLITEKKKRVCDGSLVLLIHIHSIPSLTSPLHTITMGTCSLKQNLYPWFRRHLQCISLVVITRNSIRRNRWRPRPNWRA